MQEETTRFFSPYATWTRIPGVIGSSVIGDGDATTSSECLMDSVGAAVDEYVRAYSNLIDSADLGSEGTNSDAGADTNAGAGTDVATTKGVRKFINEDYLEEYLAYRTIKDPAKRLLTGKVMGLERIKKK